MLFRSPAITQGSGGSTEVFEHVEAFLMASIDAALASQNAVVAAESMGLGVVYLGAMRNNARELAELLGLPQYSFVVFGLAVGTPDPARRSGIRPRPAQSVVLHHNRYGAVATEEWVDAYEDAFRRFREEQGMPPKTWLESVAYASSAPYLDGRENLRDTVQDRGYLLR